MSVLVQREAAAIRHEWLSRALSTLPTDRPAVEAAVSALYRLAGLSPPRFHWVASPLAALATVPPGLSHSIEHPDKWPLLTRFAELRDEWCRSVDAGMRKQHWAFDRIVQQEVFFPLQRSISSCLIPPLRRAHSWGPPGRMRWEQAQYVSWLARYDALRRIAGLALDARFEVWATALGSSHWWWPDRHVCVVSERPVDLRTEVIGDDDEVRLHHARGPAVRYADGWTVHAWHGTQVPSWVIENPTAERIADEVNVEVRRCAIEHLGWGAYIEQAGLRLVSGAPDPGNPGSELRLYDVRRGTRVLLAVNGSVERDGHRRRYGLTVPAYLNDPIEAAGWTYGLSGEQYATLLRRT
ncbi:DUF6745 domain-containing protein [Nonomuraea sp. NPDC048882]|uniref:DUF6745 domain-containing protein n=1 Tax=Nonomuraea sp. NPDC048882 TaxID=3154347 RepID=UPI00340BB6B8